MVDEPTQGAPRKEVADFVPSKERPKIKYKKPKAKPEPKVIIEGSLEYKLKELSTNQEDKLVKLIDTLNHNSLYNKVKLNKPKPYATTDTVMFKKSSGKIN